ncbi:MAG: protein kinase [Desulfobacterales bacterium]|nr:protein kinase [Desulfobacterales bacterium]
MKILPGKQFGPYQIVDQIGEGGMATVFKAYQPKMDRYVAIKILPRHLSKNSEFVERFSQEARVIAKLEHPHILPVHDFGESDGYTYLVMRLVEGGSLGHLLKKHRKLELPQIARFVSQVGGALDYAHKNGVIHRDFKPDNVLLDEFENCLLTDFGIAKLVEVTTNLTATGGILGTPTYVSPEQGMGEKIDHRSDIYSLGVVLYQMVTGDVPYKADTPMAVIFQHIHAPLPLPRQKDPNLPEQIERIILKSLSKNADDRFDSVADMVSSLQKAVSLHLTRASKADHKQASISDPHATNIVTDEPPKSEKSIVEADIQPESGSTDIQKKNEAGKNRRWVFAIVPAALLAIIAGVGWLYSENISKSSITTPNNVGKQNATVESTENDSSGKKLSVQETVKKSVEKASKAKPPTVGTSTKANESKILSQNNTIENINNVKKKKEEIPADVTSDVKEKIKKLNSSDAVECARAAHQLGRMGAKAEPAIPFLIEILSNDNKLQWQNQFQGMRISGRATSPGREAADALGSIGEPAVEPLIEALKREDSTARKRAIEALMRIGDVRSVEPFIAALKDKDSGVRNRAAIGLTRAGHTSAVELEPLIAGLKDEPEFTIPWNIPSQAAEALGEIGDDRAVEPLIEALKERGYTSLQFKAAKALGKIGDARAVEPLVEALKDDYAGVRKQAAASLGEIGDARSVEPLIDALKDGWTVRPAAAALGKIGDTRAVEPLIEIFNGDGNARLGAADALKAIGDPRAVEPFIKALQDEDAAIKYRARFGLRKITGQRFGGDPVKWQEWWDEHKDEMFKGR